MSGRAGAIGAVIIGLLAAACTLIPGFAPAPTGRPCAEVFDAERCELIAFAAAEQRHLDASDIEALLILPDPTPEVREDGTVVLQVRSGGGFSVRVLLTRDRATTVFLCGGISAARVPACMDDPHLRALTPTSGAYRDVPCAGEPPAGCATRHPDPDPDARAAATPIEVPEVSIAIDRVGSHEVVVGAGSLPNGILTEASFEFVDDWPPGVLIARGEVTLVVRSLEPDGRSFDNYYEHGWREGPERIEAVLTFDVERFEPGATLGIRNVVVR